MIDKEDMVDFVCDLTAEVCEIFNRNKVTFQEGLACFFTLVFNRCASEEMNYEIFCLMMDKMKLRYKEILENI